MFLILLLSSVGYKSLPILDYTGYDLQCRETYSIRPTKEND